MKKFLFYFSACVLALAMFFAGIATWRLYEEHVSQLSLTLTGNREIYLEYGQDYIEPGAKSIFAGEAADVDVPVLVQGQVDVHHLGTYLLKYSAQMEGLISTDYRRIYVVDTQKPVIILNGEPDAYILPGQTYTEEGFRATDNYDGDITNKVVRKEANGIITYTVADSSGNTFTTQRTINYLNPGLPDIQLVGSEIYLLAQGDTFADPGATATDKHDGDVSSSIMVEGVLDTATPGLYTLRYTAVNSYGYSSSTQRTVYVLPMEHLLKETETPSTPSTPTEPSDPTYPENCIIPQGGMAYAPTGKVIYLTYDDGPSQHTETLLDVLAKYQVKVSFFVVQSSKIDLIARAAQEGHTVAIHTYTHNYSKIYASDAAFLADLQKMQEVIKQQTGQTTMLSRFPGGGSNTVSKWYSRGIMTRLTKTLTDMGFTYFDWNVDSDDAGSARTPEKVFENITNGVQWFDNSVVLQHDNKDYSVAAVEKLIVWGLVNGYRFQPLTADSPTCHHPVLN